MYTFVKRRLLLSWIALLAVLFSALAPSVSHALAASSPLDGLAEICTVNGVKTVKLSLADGDQPAPKSLAHHFEHCPYCMSHGGAPALPPANAGTVAVLTGHDTYPPLFYHAPRSLYSWAAANPRAPPVHAC